MAERYWPTALSKVQLEGRCRVCSAPSGLEAAHVIGRLYDRKLTGAEQAEYQALRMVEAVDIVPLCRPCHGRYDARKLDLLPYLDHAEQAAAVRKVGMVSALRRICSAREVLIATAFESSWVLP